MERKHGRVLDAAAWTLGSGVFVATICGATAALAGKGLVNRRRHTSNDLEYLKMTCPGYSGSDFYVSAPAVAEENLITATELAPLEFSYEVFKACGVMREKTFSAWYKLYAARDPASYYALMESLA